MAILIRGRNTVPKPGESPNVWVPRHEAERVVNHARITAQRYEWYLIKRKLDAYEATLGELERAVRRAR